MALVTPDAIRGAGEANRARGPTGRRDRKAVRPHPAREALAALLALPSLHSADDLVYQVDCRIDLGKADRLFACRRRARVRVMIYRDDIAFDGLQHLTGFARQLDATLDFRRRELRPALCESVVARGAIKLQETIMKLPRVITTIRPKSAQRCNIRVP
nr:hypothetical protein [Rhizobium rhizogenes]ASK42072.1 hypothetical protein [Rhizobium rhizogenes]